MIVINKVLKCPNHGPKLYEPRKGIMLHFDDSSSDESAWQWFCDPACHVSYNYLVLDNGDVVQIVPKEARAWHAGLCKPSITFSSHASYKDANSAFYGVAAATDNAHRVTAAQEAAIANLCRALYAENQWPLTETWRITGHDLEAVFPAKLPSGKPHPKAGQRGRKIDPTGTGPRQPILSLEAVRHKVAA